MAINGIYKVQNYHLEDMNIFGQEPTDTQQCYCTNLKLSSIFILNMKRARLQGPSTLSNQIYTQPPIT